VTKYYFF